MANSSLRLSFLFTRLTGLKIDQSIVDSATLWGLIVVLVISLCLNLRPWMGRFWSRMKNELSK